MSITIEFEPGEVEALLRNLPPQPVFHGGFGGWFASARRKLREAVAAEG
jgi:hypothetical protein